MNIDSSLIQAVRASLKAGKAIMEFYNSSFKVEYKADSSPLTSADNAAHQIILSVLSQTGIPVLSEEGKDIPFEIRKDWEFLWVVDPLDGTKEFINHNGEFTVNIALIQDGKPVAGVIFVPVSGFLYYGDLSHGAYRLEIHDTERIELMDLHVLISISQPLPVKIERPVTLMGSRSHQTTENSDFINRISEKFEQINVVNAGSSLKFCRIAEGAADIYPRLGTTMEWDTAAGDAICRSVGAKVMIYNTDNELRYNKQELYNPWFLALARNFKL